VIRPVDLTTQRSDKREARVEGTMILLTIMVVGALMKHRPDSSWFLCEQDTTVATATKQTKVQVVVENDG